MSLNEHCMTPQPGSYICSFLVNYTSEMSTPEPPGDNFDPLMALPAPFLLPGYRDICCKYLGGFIVGRSVGPGVDPKLVWETLFSQVLLAPMNAPLSIVSRRAVLY